MRNSDQVGNGVKKSALADKTASVIATKVVVDFVAPPPGSTFSSNGFP
jgi:hypothetical protein